MARLCAALVRASREHREDLRPHARIVNEFVLAWDIRFASRQSPLSANPRSASDWSRRRSARMAPACGRPLAGLEIVLSGDDFELKSRERYGWVNRTVHDDDLYLFVDSHVRRWSRSIVKREPRQEPVSRFGMPTAAELQSSNDLFFPLLALPGAQARRAKVRNAGYGVRSDFELNFGRYLPEFGRSDDDDRDAQPD